jgi:hypothetical protein
MTNKPTKMEEQTFLDDADFGGKRREWRTLELQAPQSGGRLKN